jgi:hypothetical protein
LPSSSPQASPCARIERLPHRLLLPYVGLHTSYDELPYIGLSKNTLPYVGLFVGLAAVAF